KADYVERERAELLAHRFFVEHAQDRIFAVDAGHDRDTKIDGSRRAAVEHAETAVLRHAALGDVQFAHHLDSRNDGGVVVFADGRHGRLQHAIDAIFNSHGIVAPFDVDI